MVRIQMDCKAEGMRLPTIWGLGASKCPGGSEMGNVNNSTSKVDKDLTFEDGLQKSD